MKDLIEHHPWIVILIILLAFGIAGTMDLHDEVRAAHADRCPGVIDIEGNLVVCTVENQKPFIIGDLK